MDMTEPAGFEWGRFQNVKGANIRYGHVKPDGVVRGCAVVVGGFRESIEKYFEVTRDLLNRGIDVWLVDWRGQGGSDRYLKNDPQKSHHEGYDEQIATLHQFTQQIVKKEDKPLFLIAHSMGAHIGLRYLKEHAGVFTAAALSSPMIDIHTMGIPGWLARQWVRAANAMGGLEEYIPGGAPWNEAREIFEKNDRTNDRSHFESWINYLAKNPDLQMGSPTYGWLHHTFESIEVLKNPTYLASINTPVLIGLAGNDKVVIKERTKEAAAFLPSCKLVDFPSAKHEIWMEQENVRNAWLPAVASFIDEQIKKNTCQPRNGRSGAPGGPKT